MNVAVNTFSTTNNKQYQENRMNLAVNIKGFTNKKKN